MHVRIYLMCEKSKQWSVSSLPRSPDLCIEAELPYCSLRVGVGVTVFAVFARS